MSVCLRPILGNAIKSSVLEKVGDALYEEHIGNLVFRNSTAKGEFVRGREFCPIRVRASCKLCIIKTMD